MRRWKIVTITTNLVLTLATLLVVLDTFVIPKSYASTTTSTSTVSENTENVSTETTAIESVVTANSYTDENISITINTIRAYDTDIYIADVVVSDISYLKTALANNTYGRNIKATTSEIAEDNNAILAINGDFYGFRDYGYVIRNGTLYRSNGSSEALIINNDGSFSIVDEATSNLEELLANGAWQALSFGPALVVDSEIAVDTDDEVSQSKNSNPRTAIGMISPLHYVFIVSDGRTSQSAGLSLYELATIMQEYGVTVGYNLDGGGSSTMYFNGEIVNNPTSGNSSGERKVSDIVYIGY